jgi:hypothetical protein
MKLFILLFFSALLIFSLAHADEFEQYKNTCVELGFKPKTPDFGDCVLELRKRDLSKKTTKAPQTSTSRSSSAKDTYSAPKQTSNNLQYEAEANDFFRQQQVLYDKQMELYQVQQAEFARQKNEHDAMVAAAAEKERKEKGMRQLEMGLRMLAGESVQDAAMGAARIPPLRVAPPSMPRMQFQENYRITTPNGGLVNCRYDPNIRQATCY